MTEPTPHERWEPDEVDLDNLPAEFTTDYVRSLTAHDAIGIEQSDLTDRQRETFNAATAEIIKPFRDQIARAVMPNVLAAQQILTAKALAGVKPIQFPKPAYPKLATFQALNAGKSTRAFPEIGKISKLINEHRSASKLINEHRELMIPPPGPPPQIVTMREIAKEQIARDEANAEEQRARDDAQRARDEGLIEHTSGMKLAIGMLVDNATRQAEIQQAQQAQIEADRHRQAWTNWVLGVAAVAAVFAPFIGRHGYLVAGGTFAFAACFWVVVVWRGRRGS